MNRIGAIGGRERRIGRIYYDGCCGVVGAATFRMESFQVHHLTCSQMDRQGTVASELAGRVINRRCSTIVVIVRTGIGPAASLARGLFGGNYMLLRRISILRDIGEPLVVARHPEHV